MTPFPFTEDTPVQFAQPLPLASDVVIIGGGILGVTTALFLARRNISVTVLEKGRIAAEQSSRNWGWIRQQGRDEDELPIMIEARRLWQQLAKECGEDIGLRETGVTYMARTDQEMADFAQFAAFAKTHDVDTRMLDANEIATLIPGMSRRFKGAMLTPSDMRAEAWVAVPAIARMAVREGVIIIENCAARMLDLAAGRISGVVTEKGRIATSKVLVASGAWTSLFLRAHGISIPQLGVRLTVAATAPMPEVFAGAATDEHIAFRRRLDGGYTLAPGGSHQLYIGPDAFRHATKYFPALKARPLGTRFLPAAPRGYPDSWSTPRKWDADKVSPFERMRVLSPAPEAAGLRSLDEGFRGLFPQFKSVPLKASWGGMIDAMPDVVPIIDHAPEIAGLTIATGLSGHGFGIGPGMGRVLSDMIQGNATGHDLNRFRLSRFTDGSPIKPGPAI